MDSSMSLPLASSYSTTSSTAATEQFRYVLSCDLEEHVQVKVCTLEGALPRVNYEQMLERPLLRFSGRNMSKFPDLMVEAAVVDENGQPIHVPAFTAYKHFSKRWEWNQWISLPVKYSDLGRNSWLRLTLYDCEGPPDSLFPEQKRQLGVAGVSFFGRRSGAVRQGQVDLQVGDLLALNANDGQSNNNNNNNNKGPGQLQRLTRLSKQYRSGALPTVDWLDRLTLSEIERINQKEKQNSNLLYLMVEFPEFRVGRAPCTVVHFERHGGVMNGLGATRSDIIGCPDYDILQENLVEAKHHQLARSQRAVQFDKDLKPNAEIRNRLNEILSTYQGNQPLSSEEQDLIWKYRYYLSGNKKALAKFVRCINWRSRGEAAQALELVNKWAPMDAEDALELLGPAFAHQGLRQYAVNRLRQANDVDLQLYLLQLVQALKYERLGSAWLAAEPVSFTRSTAGSVLSEEGDDDDDACLPPAVMTVERSIGEAAGESDAPSAAPNDDEEPEPDSNGALAEFLIDRACRNSAIANYFYWYLVIECESPETPSNAAVQQSDGKFQEMYSVVLRRLLKALSHGPAEWKERGLVLRRQHKFIDKLVQLIKAVERESGNRKKKIEHLQALLAHGAADSPLKFNFSAFEPLHLPLDPSVIVRGLVPAEATLFKSSLMPARLTFLTADGGSYVTLFKHGDDLRQDQLILQIITLMDRILQQENLDLKLTPYRVLATSSKHGFVQFVDSVAVADVLTSDGTIQAFFRKHAPSETGPYGIAHDVMDTYVKSCAGYCVITYLLGVGDRHLDNLLLTRTGKLFHIDFGYILGRDPKVMPPPMKLSREMIEAFGGMTSEHFQEFKKQCYTAYLSLRRYSNVILNLFSLMVDASVPDIALEPDKTVRKVQDKFRLDLNDEEAVRYMQSLIDLSATAVMAAIVERLHKFAQFWRN